MNIIFILIGVLLAITVIAISVTNLIGYKRLNKTLETLGDNNKTDSPLNKIRDKEE